jgi:WD40 repeat protein
LLGFFSGTIIMRKLRFNIANLLVVIFFLGVGFAALRESNEIWDGGIFTLTLGVLLTSTLLTIHRTESRRAFWLGFALFGWIYLALTLIPSTESRLITTKALHYLDSKVPGRSLRRWTIGVSITGSGTGNNPVSNVIFSPDGSQLVTSSPGPVRLWNAATGKLLGGWSGTNENFVRIGHSLLALLVGWLGGQLSRRLYRSSRQADVSTSVDAVGSAS